MTGLGIKELRLKIQEAIYANSESKFRVDNDLFVDLSKQIGQLSRNAQVKIVKNNDGSTIVSVRGPSWITGKLKPLNKKKE